MKCARRFVFHTDFIFTFHIRRKQSMKIYTFRRIIRIIYIHEFIIISMIHKQLRFKLKSKILILHKIWQCIWDREILRNITPVIPEGLVEVYLSTLTFRQLYVPSNRGRVYCKQPGTNSDTVAAIKKFPKENLVA